MSYWRILLGLSLSDPTRFGRPPQAMVLPTDPPAFLGSGGRPCPGSMGQSLLPRSLLVAGSRSSREGGLSISDIPQPSLRVRCVRCRLACSLGRGGHFRPLVSGGSLPIHQCQGAFGGGVRSSPLSVSGLGVHSKGIRGQFHRNDLPAEGGGHSLSNSESHNSENSQVGDSSPHCSRPQFLMGKDIVLADALSRPDQVLGSEWTLKLGVFQDLSRKWPMVVDLFATSSNHQYSLYFSPFHIPKALGTDAFLHSWGNLLVYAFPPWALIPQVLKNLHSLSGVVMTLIAPCWPKWPWFLDLLDLVVDNPLYLPMCPDLLRLPHFRQRHLGIHRLSLHAWVLSSALPGLKLSQSE